MSICWNSRELEDGGKYSLNFRGFFCEISYLVNDI